MKEIVVLSGKGGAGKTSIAAAMFALTPHSVAVDADVDAADLAMLLGASTIQCNIYMGRKIAQVDLARCSGCGICARKCAFDALQLVERKAVVDTLGCEGCGVCEVVCPRGAMKMQPVSIGTWEQSATPFGRLLHARLLPGEENSGKFVAMLRQEGRKTAKLLAADWMWTDGPPGVGCSAISSMSGADRVLLVVAPGESGRHDAKRSLELALQFRIPVDVVSNKGSEEDVLKVQLMAHEFDACFLGAIARDEEFVDAEFAGKPVLSFASKPLLAFLETMNKKILETLC